MTNFEAQYKTDTINNQWRSLMRMLIEKGTAKDDRTGTGTVALFGGSMRFDLADQFPLLGVKKTSVVNPIAELMWMLSGECGNIKPLQELGIRIWDEWATVEDDIQERLFTIPDRIEWYAENVIGKTSDTKHLSYSERVAYVKSILRDQGCVESYDDTEMKKVQKVLDSIGCPRGTGKVCVPKGSLGPVYGVQWRNYGGQAVDQLAQCVDDLKNNRDSRRIIVEGWNPLELPEKGVAPNEQAKQQRMALAPCHKHFQCVVIDGKLNVKMYLRSSDAFLGLPYNVAQYAYLTHHLAREANLEVGVLEVTFGDVHLYKNHIDIAKRVLEEEDMTIYDKPQLDITGVTASILDVKAADALNVKVTGYNHNKFYAAPIAV